MLTINELKELMVSKVFVIALWFIYSIARIIKPFSTVLWNKVFPVSEHIITYKWRRYYKRLELSANLKKED